MFEKKGAVILPNQLPLPADIAAILPCYGPAGDNTAFILCSGQPIIIKAGINTAVRLLARRQAIDLREVKRRSLAVTQRTCLPPLPLTPELILFPVKIRIPRVPGDFSHGFINLPAVTGIVTAGRPGRTVIKLAGGRRVMTLWSAKTVSKHRHLARLAAAQAAGSPLALYSQPSLAQGLGPGAGQFCLGCRHSGIFAAESPNPFPGDNNSRPDWPEKN